jgi:hypothetical protein
MRLEEVFQALSESEISCGVETNLDGGIAAWMEDHRHGKVRTETYYSVGKIDKIVEWLDSTARDLYPNSKYVLKTPVNPERAAHTQTIPVTF